MRFSDGSVEVLVLSTKRSSHHAFIEGLLKNRNSTYVNNCLVRKDELIPGEVVEEPCDSSVGGDDVRLVSLERLFKLPDVMCSPILRGFFANFDSAVKIIFMRDPINTASSTFNIYEKVKNNPSFSDPSFVKDNLAQFVNLTNYLCSGKCQDDGVTFVYANRFWSDLSYRLGVLKSIGFSDAEFTSKMSFYGKGGNSFFGNKKEVRADDLVSRYKVYRENPEFMSLVNDKTFYEASTEFLDFVADCEMKAAFLEFFGGVDIAESEFS